MMFDNPELFELAREVAGAYPVRNEEAYIAIRSEFRRLKVEMAELKMELAQERQDRSRKALLEDLQELIDEHSTNDQDTREQHKNGVA